MSEIVPQEETLLALGEGESRVMKTTVSKVVAAVLEAEGVPTGCFDAGSFFRRTTVGTKEKLRQMGIENPADVDVFHASLEVVQAGIPFNEERKWPDLHTADIDRMVGRVSANQHVQDTAERWWDITPSLAVANGKQGLVFDARNPRERTASWRAANPTRLILEILCECDPGVAAMRTLRGRGAEDPMFEEWRDEKAAIIDRRRRDRERPKAMYPYVDPTLTVDFEAGMDPRKVMGKAYDDSEDGLPVAVRVDTGLMNLPTMKENIRLLTLAALELVQ